LEQEIDTLYIPLGLKTRSEIFDGFGKSELLTSIVVTLIGGVLDAAFWFIFKNPAVCVVAILTIISGSVMMLTKDKTNISVADQIKFMVRFAKLQKKYSYRYLPEWNNKY
jgi:mannitol-specific phosphotransferase system IIBC component